MSVPAAPRLAAPAALAFDPFELAPDPACVLDSDGALLKANAAFRALFRFEVGSRRPPWGRVRPPAFVADQRRFEAPAPDGRLYEWSERRLADGARLASARDVTDRVAAAAEAARAKTLVFATLTHELRTPLNGILGMAGLLAQEPLSASQADYVAAIADSGERLLALISDGLDFARLEAGRVELDQAPFDPLDTAQSVAELLAPRARAKGLELLTVVDAPIPSVVGDEGRFRQVLFNLVGNAVKFTEEGGVVIQLTAEPAGHDEIRLTAHVRDTGPGVPSDQQDHIFAPFEQAGAGHARAQGGAGLGLAIVRRLADLMGGRARLEQAAGGGAVFSFDAPFPKAERPPPRAALQGVSVRVEAQSALFADGLSRLLRAEGARVGPNGDLTLFEPRDGAPPPPLPAVALLWPDQRGLIESLRAAGVGYLIKPIRRASLVRRVQLARAALAEEPDAPIAPPSEQRLKGLRVLVAEDNPINALLVRAVLGRAGAAVEVVGDGEQAIAAARAERFDAILLDLRMPVIGGVAAARAIRAFRPDVPIMALTADADEGKRQAALRAGMDGFQTKPLDPAALADELARLSRARLQRDA